MNPQIPQIPQITQHKKRIVSKLKRFKIRTSCNTRLRKVHFVPYRLSP
jgi:hypothetical protein